MPVLRVYAEALARHAKRHGARSDDLDGVTYRVDVGLDSQVEESFLQYPNEMTGFHDRLVTQRLIVETAFVSEREASVMEACGGGARGQSVDRES